MSLGNWEDVPPRLNPKSEDLPTRRQRAWSGCPKRMEEPAGSAPMTTQLKPSPCTLAGYNGV
ncbi:hypothetical protein DES40_1700 [Litorimonas taeanensis]|uniref:Uncharacterized protein n=1 Tax=Litorimonas taeanensis TaxID=568099 RepID=A0A420WD96_9PROT|nr:hypothetical protein DES40_1700 [Litorimonas taeanensis]